MATYPHLIRVAGKTYVRTLGVTHSILKSPILSLHSSPAPPPTTEKKPPKIQLFLGMSLPPFFSEKKTVLGRGGFVQHGPQTPKAVGGNRNFFERGGVIYIVFRGAKTELEKTGVWRFLAKKNTWLQAPQLALRRHGGGPLCRWCERKDVANNPIFSGS